MQKMFGWSVTVTWTQLEQGWARLVHISHQSQLPPNICCLVLAGGGGHLQEHGPSPYYYHQVQESDYWAVTGDNHHYFTLYFLFLHNLHHTKHYMGIGIWYVLSVQDLEGHRRLSVGSGSIWEQDWTEINVLMFVCLSQFHWFNSIHCFWKV